jgi:hypothetical protein
MRPDVARDLGGHSVKIDGFLARLTVEVRDGLPETSLRLLSELLSIPAASCQAHFFALQDALGVLADQNGERDLSEAAAFGVGASGAKTCVRAVRRGPPPLNLNAASLRLS